MRLRRIELEQVRKFEGRVVVDGIGDGLNLIVGANEAGKTTLLAALRAGFLLKHTSSRARELQHHRHETAPRIALDLDTGGERLRFEKRFLQRPQAVLQVGGSRLTGDAAEQAFSERLSGDGSPTALGHGVWNLLLVGQGQSIQHTVAADARSVLQASLEAQLDSVTGSDSVREIIARVEERLSGDKGLVDRRSHRPKGRFREVAQKLAHLDERLAELNQLRDQLADDLARLESALRARSAAASLPQDLEVEIRQLESEETFLLRRAEAAAAAAGAALLLHRAEQARVARTSLTARRDEAERALQESETAVERTGRVHDAALATGEMLSAEATRMAALVAAGEAWLGAMEEVDRTRTAAVAGAAEVTFDLVEQAVQRVRLNGAAPGGRRFRVKVSDRLTIEVADLGRVEVRPAQADGLRQAMAAIGDRAQAARGEIERADSGQALDFSSTVAFRAGLARLWQERTRVERRLEEARTAFRDARADTIRAVRDRDEVRARLEALEQELADARSAVPDEALEASLEAAAVAAREAAAVAPSTGSRQTPDLKAVRDRLRTLRAGHETAVRRRSELELEIATLTERIANMQGQGLREEIEERLRERSHLVRSRMAMTHEVDVLRLLGDTLIEAEQEVRERYTAPLVRCLQPALQELLPGAEVKLDDSLQIKAVIRSGAGEESFQQLSHGTREQLAVVARLAFAEVLIDGGRPCFVVLDDALVFSDDDRLERMFKILERAGRKVQILILTCRERAFRSLSAKRLRIEESEAVVSV